MAALLQVRAADVDRITTRLFLSTGDRARNLSGFWVLIVLAAVIASAGVVADSTATVIGAMIVAPLMTPILGTALAVVLADRRELLRSVALLLLGVVSVVLTGFLLGLLVQLDVTAATNSQVAGRVSPRLIDLLAALATGAVGGFALVRSDVSDTLPGVAIAISLVPPLAVAGLTLESGEPAQSLGAVLLFATNVAAIIATGTAFLLAAQVREAAREAGFTVGDLRGRSLAVVAAGLVAIAVPLTLGTVQVVQQELAIAAATPVAQRWAAEEGWQVVDVTFREDVLTVRAIGRPPEADAASLRTAFDEAGLEELDVRAALVVGGTAELPAENP